MLFEGGRDVRSCFDVVLYSLVCLNKLRYQVNDIVNKIDRNNNDSIKRVSKDDITRWNRNIVDTYGNVATVYFGFCTRANSRSTGRPDLSVAECQWWIASSLVWIVVTIVHQTIIAAVSSSKAAKIVEGKCIWKCLKRWLTGKPDFLNSPKSLTRPLTTHPNSPLIFILLAIIPPTAAQVWCNGCSITRIVPASVRSAQWLPWGKPCNCSLTWGSISSDLSTSLSVLAGAITFGWSMGANGDDGAYGTTR